MAMPPVETAQVKVYVLLLLFLKTFISVTSLSGENCLVYYGMGVVLTC
jgi:hypothetical protein